MDFHTSDTASDFSYSFMGPNYTQKYVLRVLSKILEPMSNKRFTTPYNIICVNY